MFAVLPGALAVAYTGMIWFFSLQSSPPAPPQEVQFVPGLDKIEHAVLYAGLTFLWRWSLHNHAWLQRSLLLLSIALGVGVIDEWLQSMTPFRDASVADLGADVLGAGIIVAIDWALLRRRNAGKQSRKQPNP